MLIQAAEWMEDLIFKSSLAVFQSYQDDGRVIKKGCVHRNYATVEKIAPPPRSTGQHLTQLPTGASQPAESDSHETSLATTRATRVPYNSIY